MALSYHCPIIFLEVKKKSLKKHFHSVLVLLVTLLHFASSLRFLELCCMVNLQVKELGMLLLTQKCTKLYRCLM